MRKKIVILLFGIGIFSCDNSKTINIISKEKSNMEIKYDLINDDLKIDENRIDELFCDTTKINGLQFIGCQSNKSNFYVINENLDTIYSHHEWVFGFNFTDFNNDNFSDILLEYVTNVPDIYDLLIYDIELKKFIIVEDFTNFPAPKKIRNTGFYYSYHRSGCADYNWESDLFIISNYKAIKIGNISGIGCKESGKTGVFIYKLENGEKVLLKELLRKPGYYDDKWDFINKYWSNNYMKFK